MIKDSSKEAYLIPFLLTKDHNFKDIFKIMNNKGILINTKSLNLYPFGNYNLANILKECNESELIKKISQEEATIKRKILYNNHISNKFSLIESEIKELHSILQIKNEIEKTLKSTAEGCTAIALNML